jgi:hypothetical protein
VIINNKNGILATDISSNAIRVAFEKAIDLSSHEKSHFSINMKNHIDKFFTLKMVLKKEKEIFTKSGVNIRNEKEL